MTNGVSNALVYTEYILQALLSVIITILQMAYIHHVVHLCDLTNYTCTYLADN